MLKICVSLLILVLSVAAYDYSDGAFNEVLIGELREFNEHIDDIGHYRTRRDAGKCGHRNVFDLNKCCNNEITAEQKKRQEDMFEIKKECFREIRGNKNEGGADVMSCEKLNRTKEDFMCISECIAKKFNLLDSDGNIIEATVKDHIKNVMPLAEHHKAGTDEIIDKCLVESKQPNDSDESSSKCNKIPLRLGHCFWREFVKSCPKDLQSSEKRCVRFREHLENGELSRFNLRHDEEE